MVGNLQLLENLKGQVYSPFSEWTNYTEFFFKKTCTKKLYSYAESPCPVEKRLAS